MWEVSVSRAGPQCKFSTARWAGGRLASEAESGQSQQLLKWTHLTCSGTAKLFLLTHSSVAMGRKNAIVNSSLNSSLVLSLKKMEILGIPSYCILGSARVCTESSSHGMSHEKNKNFMNYPGSVPEENWMHTCFKSFMYHHQQKYLRKYLLTKIYIFPISYSQWLIWTVLHVTISSKQKQWSRGQHAEYFVWRKDGVILRKSIFPLFLLNYHSFQKRGSNF